MGKSSSESREELAMSVAVSLGITQEEALDLGTLAKKLAERNITFVIKGLYAEYHNYSLISVRVYVFELRGSKVKDVKGLNTYVRDPLEGVLWAAKWILKGMQKAEVGGEVAAVERISLIQRVRRVFGKKEKE